MSAVSRTLLAPRPRRRQAIQFRLEALELRQLLASSSVAATTLSMVEIEPNDTLDVAQQIGDMSLSRSVQLSGTIGNSPAGAADVDWYEFTIDRPADIVLLAAPGQDSPNFHPVLSLYNNDPFDFQDLYDITGHRQLVQSDSSLHQGLAAIEMPLGAGTYDLAVSGAGNLDFNPLLAASGLPGQTGSYHLTLAATDLPIQSGDGPFVLTTSPAAGTVMSSSPLAIRLDFSGPLDPSTINPGQTVQLLYSPGGSFDQGVQSVPLASVNFASAVNELQLFPARALLPGTYEVYLVGQSGNGSYGLADPDGIPLGGDAAHPGGQDFSFTFQVNGIDGNVSPAVADDTPATAHDLGDIAGHGVIQVGGAIGTDPFYDASNPDPLANPGNQVDLYHFRINGPGRFALAAEVFAGRIGSPLDPGVSLYWLAPDGHTLDFVAGNNNTYNQTQATDGSTPLTFDAALTAGLVAGDYYIAVSSGWNTPSPLENQPLNTPGLFDPTLTHSGSIGFSTGPYVLNLLVQPVLSPPRVIASNPAPGDVLTQSPTQLIVQFSEPVNLSQLAFAAYSQVTGEDSLAAVFVEDQSGVKYFPRFESFDAVTNTASFLMLDRLPNGNYSLHLSGAGGLTDLAGNPLTGNEPGGDWVVKFRVDSNGSGFSGDPVDGYQMTLAAQSFGPCDLGVVFPHEWQAGIALTKNPDGLGSSSPAGTTNEFRFQVLQSMIYYFFLTGSDLPAGIQLSLTDDAGNSVPYGSLQNGQILLAQLAPGTYRLDVSGWEPGLGSAVTYQLHLGLQRGWDNPPPLLSGPIPALALHFEGPIPTPNQDTAPSPAVPGGVPAGPPPLVSTTQTSPTTQGVPEVSHGLELSATSGEGGNLAIPPSEISGPWAGHVSLASLGVGPLGGVSTILQTELQTTPDRLAVSTSSTQGQGLLGLGPSDPGGTSNSSAADLNSGNEAPAQPVTDPFALSTLNQAGTPIRVPTSPRKSGTLDQNAQAASEQVAMSDFRNTPQDADMLLDETARVIARLDSTSPGSLEAIEASAVPDWANWVAVAGLISLASSRLSRWRRTRSPFDFRLFNPSVGRPTGWPWRRTALPRPHLALGRCRRPDRRNVNDQAVYAAERGSAS